MKEFDVHAIVHFYRKNGYVVVPHVFSSRECDDAVALFERYADEHFSGIMNLDRRVSRVRKIMRYPTIVSILEALQGGKVVGLQTMFLFKRADSLYAAQAWNPHQDNAYARAPYGTYITGNIAFTDQDRQNGCMYIYPGSHIEDLLPNEPVKSFHEKPGEKPGHCVSVPSFYHKVDVPMKKGSVLFLHGHTIHGSYPNVSKTKSRPMLLIPYITDGAPFIPGKTAKRMRIPLQ